jgi:hypothetical protein
MPYAALMLLLCRDRFVAIAFAYAPDGISVRLPETVFLFRSASFANVRY